YNLAAQPAHRSATYTKPAPQEGKKMRGKNIQITGPSAVSHFPAPYIFLPNLITDIAVGKAMPRLTRLFFPPRLSNAS
ncbi:hypothetical protein, partial [Novipirellula rosea]|uniref:hypothetical protein n=1 Tax=Novipirellula rosea TaxID=1031540 RepID=UPI0031E8331C